MKPLRSPNALLAVALIGYGSVARAGDAPTAEALFRAGREATERGDAEVACQRFEESYRVDAAPGTLLNIAACKEALHRLAAAWESYQHVAESLAADDDRLSLVRERLAELDKRLPRITIVSGSSHDALTVQSDGVLLSRASFGVPLPVDPGEHRVVVGAAGAQKREYVVVLDEGQRLTLRIDPGEALSRAPQSVVRVVPASVANPLRRDAGYVLLGAGIAGLAAAGVMGALYLDASSTVHDHCGTTTSCDDTGLRAAGSADRLQTTTLVTGAFALAALGVGITLWILDHHSHEKVPRQAGASIFPDRISLQLRF